MKKVLLVLVTLLSFAVHAQDVKPVEAPAPAQPAEEAPKAPKTLSVGSEGFFKPSVLLQVWYLADKAGSTKSNGIKFRRAEIAAKGEIIPNKIAYGVMFDPAKVLEFNNSTITVVNQDPAASNPALPEQVVVKQPASNVSVFQDGYITYLTPYVDTSGGQFKIPVSWEGYNSASKLLFPERALVSRQFGDQRDLGIKFTKTFKKFSYFAGFYNGTGQNTVDANSAKDGTLRLEAFPVDGLMVGGVVYGSIGERGKAGTKDRYEGDLRYERGPFLSQSEFIRGHDVSGTTAVDGQGFYTALAWKVTDQFQPIGRVGYLDPDMDRVPTGGKDQTWHYDVGLNYYILKQEARLSAVYSRFQYKHLTSNNEVIIAGQVSF